MKILIYSMTILALAGAGTLVSGCADDEVSTYPSATRSHVVAVPFFVETESMEPPSTPEQKLYEVRNHEPVLTPTGKHVTWGEFASVSGSIDVQCMAEGTMIDLDVDGLIPFGVYTIWNVTVKEPGLNPKEADMNITGIGAAGNGSGTDNVMMADAEGNASITLVSRGGDLSMFGDIEPCSLTGEFEWHVVGTYHIDGYTYGEDVGPDGTVAEQFAFIFRMDDE